MASIPTNPSDQDDHDATAVLSPQEGSWGTSRYKKLWDGYCNNIKPNLIGGGVVDYKVTQTQNNTFNFPTAQPAPSTAAPLNTASGVLAELPHDAHDQQSPTLRRRRSSIKKELSRRRVLGLPLRYALPFFGLITWLALVQVDNHRYPIRQGSQNLGQADRGLVGINGSQNPCAKMEQGAKLLKELDTAIQKGTHPMQDQLVKLFNTAQAQYKRVNGSCQDFYDALTQFSTIGPSYEAVPVTHVEATTAHKGWNIAKALLIPRRLLVNNDNIVNERTFDFSDPSQDPRKKMKNVGAKALRYREDVESLQRIFNEIDKAVGNATADYPRRRGEIAQWIGSQYLGLNQDLARQVDEHAMQIRHVDEQFCGIAVFGDAIDQGSENAVLALETVRSQFNQWIQTCESARGCQDIPDKMRKSISSIME